MQSEQRTPKPTPRHRRSPSTTLGKTMPVTSLLLNFPPPSLATLRSQDIGDHHERPPLYFTVPDVRVEDDQDTEKDYELIVSDSDEERQDSGSPGGCRKRNTPCLTCTNMAPQELAARDSAINEMCRRFCTDECRRMRLSLAGYLLEAPQTPPPPPPSPAMERKEETRGIGTSGSEMEGKKEGHTEEQRGSSEGSDSIKMKDFKGPNEEEIKEGEKEELTGLKEGAEIEKKEDPNEEEKGDPNEEEKGVPEEEKKSDLQEEVKGVPMGRNEAIEKVLKEVPKEEEREASQKAEIVALKEEEASWEAALGEQRRPFDTIRLQRARFLHDLLQDNDDDDVNGDSKDFRENDNSRSSSEGDDIAEALAKTSAMTSTTQIKQRLAARKLEFELENALAEALARARAAPPAAVPHHRADKLGAADVERRGFAFSGSSISATNSNSIDRDGAAATSCGAKTAAASMLYGESEPPRELLLYLVRMGSFNSAPKINNMDSQDDGLDIPKGLNTHELLQHFRHLRGIEQPPLLNRYFLKPSMAAQMVSQDITQGLHSLKLNPMTRSTTCNGPNSVRLLQWNILSQSLGQNNDGFVCCPEEALTWDNRKFLIVQEILQHDPDIICLQEVDHFKFLQTILGTQNYRGIFFPKPDSPCLYIEENNGPDGCAIFFKSDKFELQHCETRVLEVWRVQSNQVAIAVNLQMRSNGAEMCVCTTHLKARHGSLLSKMRNEQGRDLLRFVKAAAGDRAVLLCGDFNAEPTEPVYSTVLNCDMLRLASAYADIKEAGEQRNEPLDDGKQRLANGYGHLEGERVVAAAAEEEELSASELSGSDSDNVDGGVMSSSTRMHGNRADAVQQSIRREPAYTTWKIREDGEVCHTIDYVFYSKDHFKINNCLEFPLEDEIGKNRTPSFQYPSDHFSLVCDFEVLQKHAQSDEQQQQIDEQQQQQKCKNQ